MRILLMIVAVIVVAGGSGYYWLLEQQRLAALAASAAVEAPVVEVKLDEVYVPVEELFAGTIIKPEHLGQIPMEASALSPEMILADDAGEALLVGSVALHVLPKGVPVSRSSVVQPGDRGFLAAVLPQGKRAISIPISEVAGISGLVLPGDRVDIILTYAVPGGEIDAPREVKASETVMRNIRVLALDQRLNQSEASSAEPLDPRSTPIASTATLQVSPREAEMVTLATTLGDLSLVLNSVHDGGDAEELRSDIESEEFKRVTGGAAQPRELTLDSDVTSLLLRQTEAAAPVEDRIQRIQVVRGVSRGGITLERRREDAPAPDVQQLAGDPLETEAVPGE